MMSENEFKNWATNLNLSDECIREIQRVRLSPPARRVGSGKGNVSGSFSSKKMGKTIQFESHLLELAAIYEFDFNENVIEFYDQPTKIKLDYEINGRKRAYLKTADFFVIERERAYWVECKNDDELINLSQKNPERYYKENSEWIYFPGKEYATQFGLGFVVKESSSIKWVLQRNLRFLEDYFNNEYMISDEDRNYVKDFLGQKVDIRLSDLIEAQIDMDKVYGMVAKNELYIDLYNDLLADPRETKIYLNHSQFKSLSVVNKTIVNKKSNVICIEPGNSVIWGNSTWEILNRDEKRSVLFLYCKSTKKNLEIPIEIFEGYISSGYIEGIANMNNVNDKLHELIVQASEEDLKIANRRYSIIEKYIDEGVIESDSVTERTIRNWVKKYRDAEELYSNGFVGLLPQMKKRGNREGKLPLETKTLMERMISEKYENIKLKSARSVYRELLVKCDEMNTIPPSYATLCKAIKNRSIYSLTKAREGKRAAYKYEEFYYHLDGETVPKHGDRIFEIAHIDHTELDIELVVTKDESAKPWLTLMVDAFSRRILGYFLSFESPSFRSCMMVIRECVKNYSRLPNNIVVDGGKEFDSVYFESLLAMHRVHKKQRPPAKARFGNVVERLFGISNELLIHNLKGNTQLTKNVRQVTKSINPKNHAVWTLETLNELFKNWNEEVYDNLEVPALFETPKSIFEDSLKTSGKRLNEYISYNEAFILTTLPSPSKKLRKVQPGQGIKLTYIYYWCDEFRLPNIEGSLLEVKYDPYNIGIIYAYVNGRWLKCLSEQYKFLKGKTEKQLKFITEEIRKKRKMSSRNNTITAKMIAKFILESEEYEDNLTIEKYKAPVVPNEDYYGEQTEQENEELNKFSDDNDEQLEVFEELI